MTEPTHRTPYCLDEASIAALVDGNAFDGRDVALAHVSECSFCRYRVAAIASVTRDPAIEKEIELLEAGSRHKRPAVIRRSLTVTGLAAAAIAIILLNPARSLRERSTSESREVTRETAITTAESPRILSPSGRVAEASELRWTSVPEADTYRVRIWNHDGDVIWTTETRDTVVAIPSTVQRGISYLWEVDARTGWDRWTSSEFIEFTLGSAPGR